MAGEPCLLFQIPTEIIYAIGAAIQSKQDLSRFSRVNKILHRTLRSHLYRRDADEGRASALLWAARQRYLPTARNSLAAGADATDPRILRVIIGIEGEHSKCGMPWEEAPPEFVMRAFGNVRNNRDMLCLLLEHGAIPGLDQLHVATVVAMQMRDWELLGLLRDRTDALRTASHLSDVAWIRCYPLAYASMHGTPAMFNHFLQEVRARVSIPDAEILNREMLENVLSHGSPDMLACLLSNGLLSPDIMLSNGDLDALERVLQFSRTDEDKLAKVRILLEGGLVIGNRRNTVTGHRAFASCCAWGTADVAELLLQRPEINPNLTEDNGESPYMLAATHKFDDVFKVLVRSDRVDPAHKKAKAACVLTRAFAFRDTAMIRLLLEHGHAGEDYVWILHKAVQEENLEIITLLIEQYNVDVDSQDGFGRSPLNHAVQQQKAQVVKWLINLGADVETVNDKGQLTTYSRNHRHVWRGTLAFIHMLFRFPFNSSHSKRNMAAGI
ncbi:hypothetical protein NQ176_g2946 [Zarea fungicola]|uniref:Uncharacterized protein n=1 Tax=Zarea fungicola TaxID=93591 RepID=A0ACC1NLI2_9HYPO|nr:hypothetical protein NQ176_g2946 [Lecanicillium fungicola]